MPDWPVMFRPWWLTALKTRDARDYWVPMARGRQSLREEVTPDPAAPMRATQMRGRQRLPPKGRLLLFYQSMTRTCFKCLGLHCNFSYLHGCSPPKYASQSSKPNATAATIRKRKNRFLRPPLLNHCVIYCFPTIFRTSGKLLSGWG